MYIQTKCKPFFYVMVQTLNNPVMVLADLSEHITPSSQPPLQNDIYTCCYSLFSQQKMSVILEKETGITRSPIPSDGHLQPILLCT